MTAYCIDYSIRGHEERKYYFVHIAAKDLKSAKKKLGKKHGYETGRMIKLEKVCICGYM